MRLKSYSVNSRCFTLLSSNPSHLYLRKAVSAHGRGPVNLPIYTPKTGNETITDLQAREATGHIFLEGKNTTLPMSEISYFFWQGAVSLAYLEAPCQVSPKEKATEWLTRSILPFRAEACSEMDTTILDQIHANYLGWSSKSFIHKYKWTKVCQMYEEDKRDHNEHTELFHFWGWGIQIKYRKRKRILPKIPIHILRILREENGFIK